LKQRVLVLGAGGQLGKELMLAAAPQLECIALTRQDLDIGDAEAVGNRLSALAPQVVINAAAYTAVDAAEDDADAAQRANAEGPANLAIGCKDLGVRLLHVSTDFVFDGRSSQPYATDAPTAPLGQYGRSKLDGEQALQHLLPQALVLRSGWVYSRFGNNFVKTMLRLMSERDELAVVSDQIGTPTWARGLAGALWAAVARPELSGIYHWSDAGECSWYDFARAILEDAQDLGMLARPVHIRPIAGSEYPTAAERPRYSVLDKTRSWQDLGLQGVQWRQQLRYMLADLKESRNG
jgi:dTDP-4-dehydrorhamnose reductase